MSDGKLTEDEIKAAKAVIGRTPAGALPGSGMGFSRNPETVEHLIAVMDSMAAALRVSLRDKQDLTDEMLARDRTMAIAGGFLREVFAAGLATDSATGD